MTDQNEQFQRIIKLRSEKKSGKTTKLGDVAQQLMNRNISPRQDKFGPVLETWDQLLPAELREHCTIASVSSSHLRVVADSPAYVHELRLCSKELLEQLRKQCPAARITKIKIGIG